MPRGGADNISGSSVGESSGFRLLDEIDPETAGNGLGPRDLETDVPALRS